MANELMVRVNNGTLLLEAQGRIDTTNAAECDRIITEALKQHSGFPVVLDCEKLEYISSVGLRVVLKLRKLVADMKVVNVASEVYEIFEMTGFTEIMTIEKAYRRFSVEGCEVIGHGANGDVYRLDADTIIKVYHNPDSLADIQRERELARKAFVLGIPSAIPYDVVKIGNEYGSVFELLDAKSIARLLQSEPERLDEFVSLSVDLLKKLHATEVESNIVPDIKQIVLGWVDFLEPHLPQETWKKLRRMVEEVPPDNHLVHGDYHIKNVMVQNGEGLLIDMDTLAHGNAVFEFGSIYISYIGFRLEDGSGFSEYFSLPDDMLREFWEKTLRLYFDTDDEAVLKEKEDCAALVGTVRLYRRAIRHGKAGDSHAAEIIDLHRKRLIELVDTVDTLVFEQ